jgi:hypothetical protein
MKPFLSGNKTLCAPAVKASATPAAHPLRAALRGKEEISGPATPNIDVVKEGDKIVRLVITCACGERMEVECIYPAGS